MSLPAGFDIHLQSAHSVTTKHKDTLRTLLPVRHPFLRIATSIMRMGSTSYIIHSVCIPCTQEM